MLGLWLSEVNPFKNWPKSAFHPPVEEVLEDVEDGAVEDGFEVENIELIPLITSAIPCIKVLCPEDDGVIAAGDACAGCDAATAAVGWDTAKGFFVDSGLQLKSEPSLLVIAVAVCHNVTGAASHTTIRATTAV